MNWKIIRHGDLQTGYALAIAEIKNQHWPYGIQSQIDWMNANIMENDLHLLGLEENGDAYNLIAYLTLSRIKAVIDNQEDQFIGIGGVCIDKEHLHTGLGKILVEESNRYIVKQGMQGMLLCKDNLIPFYHKCGWQKVNYQSAEVAKEEYKFNIMTLNGLHECRSISIDRNF